MKIGFRCTPKELFYVVLEGNQTNPKIIEINNLKMPKNYSWVEQLSWVRKEIIS